MASVSKKLVWSFYGNDGTGILVASQSVGAIAITIAASSMNQGGESMNPITSSFGVAPRRRST
jgi:hypothetical protein